jgi:FkbM family methyltransferase
MLFSRASTKIRCYWTISVIRGFFLDIGANDPVVGSQTYMLEKSGWDGICVEPHPRFADALRKARKARVVECALGPESQVGKTLQLHALERNAALVPDRVLYSNLGQIVETHAVKMNTVDNVLLENGVERLDFVSVDVEGYEMEVLSSFSLQKWHPKLILIEDHLYNHAVHNFLLDHGYKLVRRTDLNMWYVPGEADFPLSMLGRFELFKKLYLSHPFRLWRKMAKRLRIRLSREK